jgi:hypothetical protein
MEAANGGEGFIGLHPPVDGGGEAYAFDLAKADGAVYQVPFIGLDPKVSWLVAHSFDAFLPRIKPFP